MNRFGDIDWSFKQLPPVYGFHSQDLISLENALQPIELQIKELARYVRIAKKHCHFPNEHGLSKDQSASIYIYTMEWGETTLYRMLNRALRSENREALKIWFPYLKLFDTALDLLPTVKESVWRGVPSDIGKNFTKNQKFTWWAISSCSSSVNVIEKFLKKEENSTLFLIEVINGKKISGYSEYKNEDEIILRVGTQFQVKADPLKRCDYSYTVHLVELDDDDDNENNNQSLDVTTNTSDVISNSSITQTSSDLRTNSICFNNILQIQNNDLQQIEILGHGVFTVVYQAKWLTADMTVVLKKLHPICLNNKSKQTFLDELSLFDRVHHPNIISFFGVCLEDEQYAFVTEYMSLGSLYQLLHKRKIKLTWSNQLSIALQSAKGIDYLHSYQPPILHRNIKSLNILLENHQSEYLVKISDFGLNQMRNETINYPKESISITSNLSWTAPEILDSKSYTKKSDIYSLGIVYWELLSNLIPYNEHSNDAMKDFVLAGHRLKIPEKTPSDFHVIIEQCWAHNSNDRPTCSDLLKMLSTCKQPIIDLNTQQILTQIYELQEYTTPRYFFVLPATIDTVQQSSHFHFKLYFLCECSNDPTRLHFAPHNGYSVKKLREFIMRYGQYLQVTLNLIKVLIHNEESILTNDTFPSDLFNRIDIMQKFLDESEIKHINEQQLAPIQSVDLIELENYLHINDATEPLGNLYRIVSFGERIHWVCQQHYNANQDFIDDIKIMDKEFNPETNELKLTNVNVMLLSELLTKGLTVSKILFKNCSIYESDFDILIDIIINRSSIQSFEINNLNIVNYLGFSKYVCNSMKVSFSNHLLSISFNEFYEYGQEYLSIRILMQNKIHRILKMSACDFLYKEQNLKQHINVNPRINEFILDYANNNEILNIILKSKTNKIERLQLNHSLRSSSVKKHFCKLLKRNRTLIEVDLLNAIDFYSTDSLKDLFQLLKQHESIKRIRLHISYIKSSTEKESLLIDTLKNNQFITHLRLSKSIISSQLIDAIKQHYILKHLELIHCNLNDNDIEQVQSLVNQGCLFHLLVSQQEQQEQRQNQSERNLTWKQNAITIVAGNGKGDQLNQLNLPQGIYVDDRQQSIYIADQNNHRIVKWIFNETSGQIVAGGNGQGCRINQLSFPTDVIVDENNNSLIICDLGNRRVVRWSLENQEEKRIIIDDIYCWGLMLNDNGDLFVSDVKRHEVKRWRKGEKEGTVIAGGNGQGDQLNQFNHPTFLFVDRYGAVYVSDNGNHRVMKWMKGAKEGIVVAGGQGQGNSFKQLSFPQGLFIDEFGVVYVASSENHRITCWSTESNEGRLVVGGNGQGQRLNQFDGLRGLSFDGKSNLYITDCWNNRIQRFEVDEN